ncbi:GNAT family N-acetyltransferase [Brevibacterium sp. CBA3109]|uniref:GNAT family N-acetyltransferase n=1 Tax=Brevibacterium koreense TaxID=3140787 RepID=A0AAU7UN38_9MICO
MTISTRAATYEDEAWLFQLHEDTHKELVEAAYGPWLVAQQQEFFGPLIEGHDVFILVSEGADVGALYLGRREEDTWLELIEVTPARQGQGIGAAALTWVVEQSAKADRGVRLQVHKVNARAKRLYEREGFAEVGETETHHLLRHPCH